MAKFCTKCGKKIEDGSVCECNKTVAAVKEETVSTGNNANEIINSLVDIVKGIFVKPIDTIKKYADDANMVLGFILIAINSLITGIMGYLLVKESLSGIMSLFFGGMGDLYSLGGSEMEIPFIKVAGIIFLIMAAYFIVLAFTTYLVSNKLFKAETTWKKAIAVTGVCSALTSVTSIIGIVCIYISMKAFAIVIGLAGMLFSVYYYHSIKASSDIDENKQGYTYVIAVAVALFVAVYLLPKIFG